MKKATVKDIYGFLDEMAPFRNQESWDNSGFLVGDPEKTVEKIAVALDVTEDTLEKAAEWGADLLVSHHPVIFNPIKNVLAGSPVYIALKHNISIISAHTSFDVAEGGVSDVLATITGLTEIEPLLSDENGVALMRKGRLRKRIQAKDFAEIVSCALDTVVRVSLPEKEIETVAVCGGAGASLLPEIRNEGIDAFLTGDGKHNDFLDATEMGISLLAAGHYETETVAMPVLKNLLKQEFPEIEYLYIESPPLIYIG